MRMWWHFSFSVKILSHLHKVCHHNTAYLVDTAQKGRNTGFSEIKRCLPRKKEPMQGQQSLWSSAVWEQTWNAVLLDCLMLGKNLVECFESHIVKVLWSNTENKLKPCSHVPTTIPTKNWVAWQHIRVFTLEPSIRQLGLGPILPVNHWHNVKCRNGPNFSVGILWNKAWLLLLLQVHKGNCVVNGCHRSQLITLRLMYYYLL